MTPSASTPTKQPFFFESKHMTRLTGFLFCLNLNQSSSSCKNGVSLYESKYPMTSANLNQMRYTCHCWTGYWGVMCDSVNPCYTLVTNSTYLPDATEPLPILIKFCQNDGICLATKATAMYFYLSGIKYQPYCLCRPQFAGKYCERNLDGCTFPFIYGNKFYNKLDMFIK